MLALIDVESNVMSLAYFLIGAILGFLILIIAIRILTVANDNYHKQIHVRDELKPTINPETIIFNSVNEYIGCYSQKKISERFNGAKKITLEMLKSISKSYSPQKEDPTLDIEIRNGFYLLKDSLKKLDEVIDSIIDSPAFQTLWKSYTFAVKTQNFFSKIFKKDKAIDDEIHYNIRMMRASYVIERVMKSTGIKKNEKDTTSENESTEKSYFLLDNLINSKITEFIKYVGSVAIEVYSKQYNNKKELQRGEQK